MANHDQKRLSDGKQATHEDLRESVTAWTQEIANKCKAHGMPVGVIVIVVPVKDPKPAWSHNMTPGGVQRILSHVADDIAVKGGGIALAPASALAKA